MSLPWIYLIVAGLLEVCWAIGLKYTEGFTRPVASIFTIITFSLSMFLLAKATHALPIGTAYAIWVGIGVLGAVVLGAYLFNEPVSVLRALFVVLLLVSILGLKLTA